MGKHFIHRVSEFDCITPLATGDAVSRFVTNGIVHPIDTA